MWNLLKLTKSGSKADKKLVTAIKTIAGFSPSNLELYKLALLHSSKGKEINGFRESNERLEYLGDAILGAAIADYLFKKYPFKDEGFLTEIRSRIVNRESLNNLARKIGVGSMVQFDHKNSQLRQVILGNTLEALVGAIYLDQGYKKAAKWVLESIIHPHMFMDDLENLEINHKNKLYGWANKNGKVLEFETLNEKLENGRRLFTVAAVVNGKNIAEGKAFNKKDASQIAAQIAVDKLGIVNADSIADEQG